jgi:hypothetical protein
MHIVRPCPAVTMADDVHDALHTQEGRLAP